MHQKFYCLVTLVLWYLLPIVNINPLLLTNPVCLPHSVDPVFIVVVLTGHKGHFASPVKFLCVPISHKLQTPSCRQAPTLHTEKFKKLLFQISSERK